MPEDSKIDQRIAAILAGSSLPMERRTKVAEELRSHLEESVSGNREAGLSEVEAIEAALADFGSPDIIRRQLRRQQRRLDWRYALADICRSMWGAYLLAAMCGVYAAVIAVFHPLPLRPVMRCLWGLVLFGAFFLMMFSPTYLAALLSCRLGRRRPRGEYHFFKGCLHGMGMGGVFLGYALVWTPLWVMPSMPLVLDAPEFAHYLPGKFWHIWWVAVLELADHTFGLLALGVLGFGLGVAFYQRSRCIDEPIVVPDG